MNAAPQRHMPVRLFRTQVPNGKYYVALIDPIASLRTAPEAGWYPTITFPNPRPQRWNRVVHPVVYDIVHSFSFSYSFHYCVRDPY
mmetsp:Transcript_18803/g.52879  ORF Transcript_18803/g.52879 Transcript_18803/m.52879 type:complete len:86 (+) Transcript_18803:611-868(+)